MISVKDVEHVAKLARLELTDEEKQKYTKQLSDILKYANELNEVDTEGVEPMSHALPFYNVTRCDDVKCEISKDELMKNGPDVEDGFFKVPKIN